MNSRSIFSSFFTALTGERTPFPWQCDLYERFVVGDFPRSCNIPTGLGKTSVIALWLIALANNPALVPRRLVDVVNRRTVVDQSTEEAKKLRENLSRAPEIQAKLGSIAISTLRGQFADNREWSADPSRPAVIVGTVDMVGSRLLFSGYGIGFKAKPLHAGFLGQDVLLVHDEAHLEPAFQTLVEAIRDEQERCHELRRFSVMELTATSRPQQAPFTLTDADWRDEEVKKRMEAKKAITLHRLEDENELPDKVAEIAEQYKDSKRAILVYVQSVKAVEKIADKLRKDHLQVETLTGTRRGKERDQLVDSPIFRRFLPKAESGDQTVYLVCTSAGEVGVNISADHLICDLSTFESMAQRFGRVNRFGARQDTRIDVVHPRTFHEKDEYEMRRRKTLELLLQLNGDGSPAALYQLDPDRRQAAFSPQPTILPTSDILFDAWALTSVREHLPRRPPVEPYLHGFLEGEPPETYVAWRAEVELLSKLFTPKQLEELLDDYALKPHELLRDRSERVSKHLARLALKHPDSLAWLRNNDGALELITLRNLTSDKERMNNRTMILSPGVGGLTDGMLDGESTTADDVADEWLNEEGQARRARCWDEGQPPPGMRLIRQIDTAPESETEAEAPGRRFWKWYVRPKSADDDGSSVSQKAVSWQRHTDDVVRNAERIAAALGLAPHLCIALILAAGWHDLGKKRDLWQRSIGNLDPHKPLAKSGVKMRPMELNDYRHEFGSLIDVAEEVTESEEVRELVLHLIASHHGRGRPHFPLDEAFDPERSQALADRIASEVPQRFARLQRRYGRWGLAYLESLLRAADIEASVNPTAEEV